MKRHILDLVSILLLGRTASAIALLEGGGPRILLIRESLFTGVFGLACFASLLLPRPMMLYFGRHFMAEPNPKARQGYEASWALPEVRFANRLITIVWGAVYLGEFALRVVLVYTVPAQVALVVSPILLGVVTDVAVKPRPSGRGYKATICGPFPVLSQTIVLRAQEFSEIEAWPECFGAVLGKEPRETLVRALDLFTDEGFAGGLAVDIAAGEGRDTLELLKRGWNVVATDGHPEAFSYLWPRVLEGMEAAVDGCRGEKGMMRRTCEIQSIGGCFI